jgi:hypothetical protein
MEKTLLFLIVLLLILVGIVWLQIKLSKMQSKWFGLIIPFICLLFSIMAVLGMQMFSFTGRSMTETTIDGVVVESETIQPPTEKLGIGEVLATSLPIFAFTNIPTIIFLGIYFVCREQLNKNKELERMNIQDLE